MFWSTKVMNSPIRLNVRMVSSSRMMTGEFCRKSMVRSRLEITLEQVTFEESMERVNRKTGLNNSTIQKRSTLSVQRGTHTQKGARAEGTDHRDSARGQAE